MCIWVARPNHSYYSFQTSFGLWISLKNVMRWSRWTAIQRWQQWHRKMWHIVLVMLSFSLWLCFSHGYGQTQSEANDFVYFFPSSTLLGLCSPLFIGSCYWWWLHPSPIVLFFSMQLPYSVINIAIAIAITIAITNAITIAITITIAHRPSPSQPSQWSPDDVNFLCRFFIGVFPLLTTFGVLRSHVIRACERFITSKSLGNYASTGDPFIDDSIHICVGSQWAYGILDNHDTCQWSCHGVFLVNIRYACVCGGRGIQLLGDSMGMCVWMESSDCLEATGQCARKQGQIECIVAHVGVIYQLHCIHCPLLAEKPRLIIYHQHTSASVLLVPTPRLVLVVGAQLCRATEDLQCASASSSTTFRFGSSSISRWPCCWRTRALYNECRRLSAFNQSSMIRCPQRFHGNATFGEYQYGMHRWKSLYGQYGTISHC